MMYSDSRGSPTKSFTRILKAGGAEVIGQGLAWPEIEQVFLKCISYFTFFY